MILYDVLVIFKRRQRNPFPDRKHKTLGPEPAWRRAIYVADPNRLPSVGLAVTLEGLAPKGMWVFATSDKCIATNATSNKGISNKKLLVTRCMATVTTGSS